MQSTPTLASESVESSEVRYEHEFQQVTPEQARQILDEYDLEYQRHLRIHHVGLISEAMSRGDFDNSTTIKIGVCGQNRYLLDGQHRLQAQLMSQTSQHYLIVYIHTKDPSVLRRTYMHTDSNLVRTPLEALNAFGGPGLLDLSPTKAHLGLRAMRLIVAGFGHAGLRILVRDRDRIYRAILDWKEPLHLLFDANSDPADIVAQPLTHASTIAVALVTLRYQPQKAFAFWQRVARMDGPIPGDPTHALITVLVKRREMKETELVYARRIAACWNAHFEGRELKVVQRPDPSLPIRIAGTPLDGKKSVTYDLILGREAG